MNLHHLHILTLGWSLLSTAYAAGNNDVTWAKQQMTQEVDSQLKKLDKKTSPTRKINSDSSSICSLDIQKFDAIVSLQSDASGNFDGTRLNKVSEALSKMDANATSCIIRFLLTKTNKSTLIDQYEPLHLLQYIRQVNLPIYDSEVVKLMHALRFLQVAQYPETLRILWQLKDLSPFYVKSYNQVQKIYAKTQRGQGSVALRQNP